MLSARLATSPLINSHFWRVDAYPHPNRFSPALRTPDRAEVRRHLHVHAQVKVAAYLGPLPDQSIRGKRYSEKPYWDVERARIGDTREVPVELVINGEVADRKNVLADGQVHDVAFDVPVTKSSWIAARILPAAHTNPIFVLVDGKPVRPSRRSVEWCLAAVSQCWTQKAPHIAVAELGAARKAYDQAREVYSQRLAETQ